MQFAASAIFDTFARFIGAFRWQAFSVSNIGFHLDVACCPAEAAVAAGKCARANAFLAATDRVAIDAVDLAVLKSLGSNAQIMNTKIFEQEQIARAAEIGLGAASPAEIDVVAANAESQTYRARVVEILNQG